jgi:sugar O-acyltransferase (sialic acid O-acetyltransferase NeuD family)
MKRLAILGAGGHGKIVAECAELSGWKNIVFFDDTSPRKTTNGYWPVVGNSSDLLEQVKDFDGVLVAIGNNTVRQNELSKLFKAGAKIPVVIHPSAVVSRYASIDAGSVVVGGVVINTDCKIGKGAIINTSATIDHDCLLGDFVHVCPGTNLAGGVTVGDRSWVGIGSAVRQMINIGSDVMVGAGSVVVSDVSDCSVVIGVPARAKS